MPHKFDFRTAPRIVFGQGCVSQVGAIAESLGASRVLVVCGSNAARAKPCLDSLSGCSMHADTFCVSGEPTVEMVTAAVAQARTMAADLIIGFGGGSAVDTAKAVAGLAPNPGSPFDYMEVIGNGATLSVDPLPFIAVPTTAGTGSEVTKNSVIKSEEHKVKVSVRSNKMIADVALIDASLMTGVPADVTASTGLDALTQCIEPFVSVKANFMTDVFAEKGIQLAAQALPKAFSDGSDMSAREDMAMAALYGGLALANAGLGAAHGFAGPLGGACSAPHGVICARFLPHCLAVNLRALKARDPNNPLIGKYDRLGVLLTGSPSATASDAVEFIRSLCDSLNVSPLSSFGVTRDMFPTLVQKASVSSSMKGNSIALTETELMELIEKATF